MNTTDALIQFCSNSAAIDRMVETLSDATLRDIMLNYFLQWTTLLYTAALLTPNIAQAFGDMSASNVATSIVHEFIFTTFLGVKNRHDWQSPSYDSILDVHHIFLENNPRDYALSGYINECRLYRESPEAALEKMKYNNYDNSYDMTNDFNLVSGPCYLDQHLLKLSEEVHNLWLPNDIFNGEYRNFPVDIHATISVAILPLSLQIADIIFNAKDDSGNDAFIHAIQSLENYLILVGQKLQDFYTLQTARTSTNFCTTLRNL